MSSHYDLASGTNSRAVYKERHGERQIKQFDARKFPHARTNVLTPYPTANQVTTVPGFVYNPRLMVSQIVARSSFGMTLGGEVSFDERRWHRDIFSELYNDDTLWAYSI